MAKRHLPVVRTEQPEQPPAPGPWILFVAALAFLFWVPLVLLGLAGGQRAARALEGSWGSDGPASVGAAVLALAWAVPILGSFGLACGLAGMVAGRFGSDTTPREALLGGFITSVLSWALALAGKAFPLGTVAWASLTLLVAVSACASSLGHRLGRWLGGPKKLPDRNRTAGEVDPGVPRH